MSNSRTVTKRTNPFAVRTIAIAMIQGYQTFISPLLHTLLGVKAACRSLPTCSDYAQQSIRQYGIGRGILLSVRRLINCQPLFKI